MDIVKLEGLAAGAVQEQFNRSFHKVLDNLQNPNTPYKVKRSITIKVDFVQNEQRDDVKTSIHVSEKLAPQSPIETAFSIGKDLRTGETYAEEYGKQLKGQMSFDDYAEDEEKTNFNTGEIIALRTAK